MTDVQGRQVQSCLFLAPHLELPARSGANILVHQLARHLSRYVEIVTAIGKSEIVSYSDLEISNRQEFENEFRGKISASLRALTSRSHYLAEKILTDEYRSLVAKHLEDNRYDAIVASYIFTADLYSNDAVCAVLTHNDEVKWYRDLGDNARDPFSRAVARQSESWVRANIDRIARKSVLVHVSQSDLDGYERLVPGHASAVVPIGVVIPAMSADPSQLDEEAQIRLAFVGSLGVRMNLHALRHFASKIEPELKKRFGPRLHVDIVGSNASRSLIRLADKRGWTLHQNVSNTYLSELLSGALFTILPFTYSTGAKLKLLGSLAHGVPFLATNAVATQEHSSCYPCLFSDDPVEWADRIDEIASSGIGKQVREQLLDVARRNSWTRSTELLLDTLGSSRI